MPPKRRVSFSSGAPIVVEVPRNAEEEEGRRRNDEEEDATRGLDGGAADTTATDNDDFDDDAFDAEFEAEMAAQRQSLPSAATAVAEPTAASPSLSSGFANFDTALPSGVSPPSGGFASFDSAPRASASVTPPSVGFASFDRASSNALPGASAVQAGGGSTTTGAADSGVVQRLEARITQLEEELRGRAAVQSVRDHQQKAEALETQVRASDGF